MLKRQLSYFLLQECIIKKDKEADMGECEKRVEGWFCTARSRFPKAGTANSNVSQPGLSAADATKGMGNACDKHAKLPSVGLLLNTPLFFPFLPEFRISILPNPPKRTHLNYRLFALINSIFIWDNRIAKNTQKKAPSWNAPMLYNRDKFSCTQPW